MKKYDCSKTLDYIHEQKRLCHSMPTCSAGCPLKGRSCAMEDMDQEGIDALQKWSDEHPEAPTLAKKDRAFLEFFARGQSRAIVKDSNGNSFYYYDGEYSKLADGMFEALEPSTRMTFDELLKLEVED